MLPGDLIDVSEIPCPVCKTRMTVSKHPSADMAAIKNLNICPQCGYKHVSKVSGFGSPLEKALALVIIITLITLIIGLMFFLIHKIQF